MSANGGHFVLASVKWVAGPYHGVGSWSEASWHWRQEHVMVMQVSAVAVMPVYKSPAGRGPSRRQESESEAASRRQ